MIGGLFKSASRLALVAVAGVMVGGVSAQAADLGGDCCADLEERVAELEATTVRKGNRKVSLTVSGWVHKSIMYWDDGIEKNTYAGVDNINSSTRFRFMGDAKITPKWSTGYMIEIEAFGDINSSQMNQLAPNGQTAIAPAGALASNSGTTTNVRHSAWWIENKDYGRVWVGLTDPAGAGIDGINLANTNLAASTKVGLNGGGMFLRGDAGGVNAANVANMSARTWGGGTGGILMGNNGLMNLSDESRQNVIKYVSPTVMGFIVSAAWGEDDMWDVALRYAGEFQGFKIAAGGSYTQLTDGNFGFNTNTPTGGVGIISNNGSGAGSQAFQGCTDMQAFGAAVDTANRDRDCSSWTVAGSVMHVATGLFVTANYGERTDSLRKLAFAGNAGTANIDQGLISSKDTNWSVRGGIEQNWFGLGKTTLFGEYNQFSGTPLSSAASQTTDAGLGGTGGTIVSSQVQVWGLGAVQSFDAAALDLYLAYRNFSADLKEARNVAGDGTTGISPKDFQLITFGAVMKF